MQKKSDIGPRKAIEKPRPTPTQRDRALRLLVHEARGDESPKALAAAGERMCQRLRRHAGKVLGVVAFNALFARALTLVKPDFPFLGAGRVEPQVCFEGLRESLQEQTASQAADAISAVVATFLALLADLVGEELSLSLLVDVWVEGSLADASWGETEI